MIWSNVTQQKYYLYFCLRLHRHHLPQNHFMEFPNRWRHFVKLFYWKRQKSLTIPINPSLFSILFLTKCLLVHWVCIWNYALSTCALYVMRFNLNLLQCSFSIVHIAIIIITIKMFRKHFVHTIQKWSIFNLKSLAIGHRPQKSMHLVILVIDHSKCNLQKWHYNDLKIFNWHSHR